MGQMDFISSIYDQTLQMYRLISPHCLCILPWLSNSGDTQISVYIHVPFDHAVFFKTHFGASSIFLTRLKCTCAAWSDFSVVATFFVKQLTFEICILLSKFIKGSKNKKKFGEINILDCNFLSSSYRNESRKSVGYGKYTKLNMVIFLQRIG